MGAQLQIGKNQMNALVTHNRDPSVIIAINTHLSLIGKGTGQFSIFENIRYPRGNSRFNKLPDAILPPRYDKTELTDFDRKILLDTLFIIGDKYKYNNKFQWPNNLVSDMKIGDDSIICSPTIMYVEKGMPLLEKKGIVFKTDELTEEFKGLINIINDRFMCKRTPPLETDLTQGQIFIANQGKYILNVTVANIQLQDKTWTGDIYITATPNKIVELPNNPNQKNALERGIMEIEDILKDAVQTLVSNLGKFAKDGERTFLPLIKIE